MDTMSEQNFILPPDAAARLEMLEKAETQPKEAEKKNTESKSK